MPRRKSEHPWAPVRIETLYLRVPTEEWAAVRDGHKREVRHLGGAPRGVVAPWPIVAHAVNHAGRQDAAPMVLEGLREELLMAITAEGLEAEGCASFEEFRRYWMLREGTRFPALSPVGVYRVRPWIAVEDDREMGIAVLASLMSKVKQ